MLSVREICDIRGNRRKKNY